MLAAIGVITGSLKPFFISTVKSIPIVIIKLGNASLIHVFQH